MEWTSNHKTTSILHNGDGIRMAIAEQAGSGKCIWRTFARTEAGLSGGVLDGGIAPTLDAAKRAAEDALPKPKGLRWEGTIAFDAAEMFSHITGSGTGFFCVTVREMGAKLSESQARQAVEYACSLTHPESPAEPAKEAVEMASWVENGVRKTAPKVDADKFGRHSWAENQGEGYLFGECAYGCGCEMYQSSSKGPVDPFGPCPNNPKQPAPDAGTGEDDADKWANRMVGLDEELKVWFVGNKDGANGVVEKWMYDGHDSARRGVAQCLRAFIKADREKRDGKLIAAFDRMYRMGSSVKEALAAIDAEAK